MSTYGLQVFSSTGAILLDSSDMTWSIIGVYSLPANTSQSESIITGGYITNFKASSSLQTEIIDSQKTRAPSVSLNYNSSTKSVNVSITNYEVPCTVVVLGR